MLGSIITFLLMYYVDSAEGRSNSFVSIVMVRQFWIADGGAVGIWPISINL